MALPGTPGQRISDLCNGNHITQKELAEKIGVSASQLSRIVSGETRTVSSDILIGVAKEFKVSTDYILGLSTVSVRKSYDISELGLVHLNTHQMKWSIRFGSYQADKRRKCFS